MTKRLMVDPPNGWKYEFPKLIDRDTLMNGTQFRLWLIQEGYPEELNDQGYDHSRYWEVEDE